MSATRILFGIGYLGSRVANLWRDQRDYTWAFTRRDDPTEAMIVARTLTGQADVTRPETLTCLRELATPDSQQADSLLYAVGYDRTTGPDIHSVYANGLQNVLAALPASVTRVIYISTTGVYGTAGGGWVDETTPTAPHRDGGKASLAAEEILRAHPLGRRSVILRLAGIYGPGRVPYLDKLKASEPIAAPSAGWLNLIHVDDAARIVVAMDRWLAARWSSDGPHVFCVSDGVPAVRGEYYAEAARLIGAPPPQFTTPPADSPAAARAGADRRVSNAKLRKWMATQGLALQYPSYREGLAQILNSNPAI
ncbi:NAD-dependent epimerase/dehydratase family protein [Lacipirellula parvula]|uniref:Nucleoside-diphosphate-sugar epimerase n=1 Tax=Lacipirellula parvula TaxID=2650471 RepID=A0A5K7XFX4_9BACT|nr:NAD-dependent epimerase/dehydratase family protein [Lacipirellula parvula]BBO35418.1 nucleoside-diphosphate-sugar epimerase [Lacipirellula parvula]